MIDHNQPAAVFCERSPEFASRVSRRPSQPVVASVHVTPTNGKIMTGRHVITGHDTIPMPNRVEYYVLSNALVFCLN